jgi:hypothetical protein
MELGEGEAGMRGRGERERKSVRSKEKKIVIEVERRE